MFPARVIGNMWATQKSQGLNGKKLLIVEALDGSPPRPNGEQLMAVADKIDAGIGDTVLVLDEGGSARSILGDSTAPVRALIVAVIDQIKIYDSIYYFSGDA